MVIESSFLSLRFRLSVPLPPEPTPPVIFLILPPPSCISLRCDSTLMEKMNRNTSKRYVNLCARARGSLKVIS
ncbi:MAG: hypothetical protein WDO16_14190 [Bacteroidota bacterium]